MHFARMQLVCRLTLLTLAMNVETNLMNDMSRTALPGTNEEE